MWNDRERKKSGAPKVVIIIIINRKRTIRLGPHPLMCGCWWASALGTQQKLRKKKSILHHHDYYILLHQLGKKEKCVYVSRTFNRKKFLLLCAFFLHLTHCSPPPCLWWMCVRTPEAAISNVSIKGPSGLLSFEFMYTAVECQMRANV